MRRSRQKTLADLVAAAMRLTGTGVLALGRAVRGDTTAKHSIKRVWRFFRNRSLETSAVQQAMVNTLASPHAPVVVLLDWTDHGRYTTLAAALSRDGRALPVWWKTILKNSGKGSMKTVEEDALWELRRLFWFYREVILVADRGFGNTRWLAGIQKWGWKYVQRVSKTLYVENETNYSTLGELPLSRGDASHDWGQVLLTLEAPFPTRLVTTWARRAEQPWYLVTNLEQIPQKIVRLYQRRMWIEEMFRDLKNRKWGLGFAESELSTPNREERRWAVLALAYMLLMAYGAVAEEEGLASAFSPNPVRDREINLARLGSFILQTAMQSIVEAIEALNRLPP